MRFTPDTGFFRRTATFRGRVQRLGLPSSAPPRGAGVASPDYSGFPHTEACNASPTRVLGENPTFTRRVNHHSGPGWEMPIAVLPGQGVKLVYSTHPPYPHP